MKLSTIFSDRSVAALTEKHSAARENVAVARTRYHDATFEAESGEASAIKAKEAARKTLDAAETRAAELAGAIEVARSHESAAEAKAAREERAQRWENTLKLAKVRGEAAAKVETAIAALTAGYQEMTEASKEIAAECPIQLVDSGDLNGFFVRPESLAVAVKLTMRRAGLEWAIGSLTPTHEIPTLCERLGQIDDNLARMRAADGAG